MSNRRYTPEFKDEAARQIVERGHSVVDVSKRLSVSAHRTNATNILLCLFILSSFYPTIDTTASTKARSEEGLMYF